MIIRQLRATDFMRFHKVELRDIPESGLIAIKGENESGKSTIGHLLVYAVSGKPPEGIASPVDLINWEAAYLTLELEFISNGNRYFLQRQVDRDGASFASLSLKDGDVLAQGGSDVTRMMQEILGYPPECSEKAFMIRHRNVRALVEGAPRQQLENMLGIDRLKGLVESAGEDAAIAEGDLSGLGSRLGELEEKSKKIGYDAIKEKELIAKREELNRSKEGASKELTVLRGAQSEAEKQYRWVEQNLKILSDRIEEKDSNGLGEFCGQRAAGLADMTLKERAAELQQDALSRMRNIQDCIKGLGGLRENYESRLNGLREELGISKSENQHSLKGEIAEGEKKITALSNSRRRRLKGMGMLTLVILMAVATWIWRLPILLWAKDQSWIMRFYNGKLEELWQQLGSYLRTGKFGVPTSPYAIGVVAVVGLILMFSLKLFIGKSRQLKKAIQEQKATELRHQQLEQKYRDLLAADFDDLREVFDIVIRSGEEDLAVDFKSFTADHPDLAEKDYQFITLGVELEKLFEELLQTMDRRVNRKLQEVQSAEEICVGYDSELAELAPVLKDMEEKKAKVAALAVELEDLKHKMIELRLDHERAGCLADLSKGAVRSALDRMAFELTALYKVLLPKVTQQRYASVKLDDDFKLMIFSEERGDFVPLHQLSSGTHDMMLLLFQLILNHGWMESHQVERHFIFMDEPLLAVDPVRYQLLCSLLPDLSRRLGQVFLCRPPESLEQCHLVQTALDQRNLELSFS